MYRDFLLACLLSLVCHLGLLFGLPAPIWESFVAEEIPRDVELVAMTLPDPQVLNADESLELTPAPQPPPPPPKILTFDNSRIAPISHEQIDGIIEQASQGVSMELTMPALELPAQKPSDILSSPAPPPLPPPPVDTSEVVAALLESSPDAPGQPQGKAKAVGLGQLRLGEKQAPSRMATPEIDPQLLAPPPPQAAVPVTLPIPEPEPELGIQGPVAKREPLSQPALPEVVVVTDSEITLKFWVRPDGVVSRIVTVRKDNTELEAAAIRYLSGWRFSPLLPHEAQEEQWGTITVRFLRPTR
ncbi:energy transducer TonB family protein [Candidatus Entotheonella palauensis]|uniref:energy transducer TonB family protein n=1 Tax=Candidatus Entotheonella palauensis TaxID=93172 RepID=UPI000B7D3D5A|nr:energy transducer TonB [Candidatus Entotheonella palauensis]